MVIFNIIIIIVILNIIITVILNIIIIVILNIIITVILNIIITVILNIIITVILNIIIIVILKTSTSSSSWLSSITPRFHMAFIDIVCSLVIAFLKIYCISMSILISINFLMRNNINMTVSSMACVLSKLMY